MSKFRPEIEIPKNVKLTEEFIEGNRDQVKGMMEWFLNYPDLLI